MGERRHLMGRRKPSNLLIFKSMLWLAHLIKMHKTERFWVKVLVP